MNRSDPIENVNETVIHPQTQVAAHPQAQKKKTLINSLLSFHTTTVQHQVDAAGYRRRRRKAKRSRISKGAPSNVECCKTVFSAKCAPRKLFPYQLPVTVVSSSKASRSLVQRLLSRPVCTLGLGRGGRRRRQANVKRKRGRPKRSELDFGSCTTDHLFDGVETFGNFVYNARCPRRRMNCKRELVNSRNYSSCSETTAAAAAAAVSKSVDDVIDRKREKLLSSVFHMSYSRKKRSKVFLLGQLCADTVVAKSSPVLIEDSSGDATDRPAENWKSQTADKGGQIAKVDSCKIDIRGQDRHDRHDRVKNADEVESLSCVYEGACAENSSSPLPTVVQSLASKDMQRKSNSRWNSLETRSVFSDGFMQDSPVVKKLRTETQNETWAECVPSSCSIDGKGNFESHHNFKGCGGSAYVRHNWYCLKVNNTAIRLKRDKRKASSLKEAKQRRNSVHKLKEKTTGLLNQCKPCSVVLVDFMKCLNLVNSEDSLDSAPNQSVAYLPNWKEPSEIQCTAKQTLQLFSNSEIPDGVVPWDEHPEDTLVGLQPSSVYCSESRNALLDAVELYSSSDCITGSYCVWSLADTGGPDSTASANISGKEPGASAGAKIDDRNVHLQLHFPKLKKICDSVVQSSKLAAASEQSMNTTPEEHLVRVDGIRADSSAPTIAEKSSSVVAESGVSLISQNLEDCGQEPSSEIIIPSESDPVHYSCLHCIYKTLDGSCIREHIYIHTDVIPFMCGLCGATFGTQSGAGLHSRREHPDQEPLIIIEGSTISAEQHYRIERGSKKSPGEDCVASAADKCCKRGESAVTTIDSASLTTFGKSDTDIGNEKSTLAKTAAGVVFGSDEYNGDFDNENNLTKEDGTVSSVLPSEETVINDSEATTDTSIHTTFKAVDSVEVKNPPSPCCSSDEQRSLTIDTLYLLPDIIEQSEGDRKTDHRVCSKTTEPLDVKYSMLTPTSNQSSSIYPSTNCSSSAILNSDTQGDKAILTSGSLGKCKKIKDKKPNKSSEISVSPSSSQTLTSSFGEISIITCSSSFNGRNVCNFLPDPKSPVSSGELLQNKQKQYSCQYCDYISSGVSDVENHVFIVHPRLRRLVCPVCKMYFCKFKPAMLAHFSSQHREVKPAFIYELGYRLLSVDARDKSGRTLALQEPCLPTVRMKRRRVKKFAKHCGLLPKSRAAERNSKISKVNSEISGFEAQLVNLLENANSDNGISTSCPASYEHVALPPELTEVESGKNLSEVTSLYASSASNVSESANPDILPVESLSASADGIQSAITLTDQHQLQSSSDAVEPEALLESTFELLTADASIPVHFQGIESVSNEESCHGSSSKKCETSGENVIEAVVPEAGSMKIQHLDSDSGVEYKDYSDNDANAPLLDEIGMDSCLQEEQYTSSDRGCDEVDEEKRARDERQEGLAAVVSSDSQSCGVSTCRQEDDLQKDYIWDQNMLSVTDEEREKCRIQRSSIESSSENVGSVLTQGEGETEERCISPQLKISGLENSLESGSDGIAHDQEDELVMKGNDASVLESKSVYSEQTVLECDIPSIHSDVFCKPSLENDRQTLQDESNLMKMCNSFAVESVDEVELNETEKLPVAEDVEADECIKCEDFSQITCQKLIAVDSFDMSVLKDRESTAEEVISLLLSEILMKAVGEINEDIMSGDFSSDKCFSHNKLDKSGDFSQDAPVGFSIDNKTDVFSNDELDKSDNLSHDDLDKSDDFPQDATAGFSSDDIDVLSCDELDKSDNFSNDELDKSDNFPQDASTGFSNDNMDVFPQNELDKSDDFPQDATACFSNDNKTDGFTNDELDKSDNFSHDAPAGFSNYKSDVGFSNDNKTDGFENDELDISDDFPQDATAGFSNDKIDVFPQDELDKPDNFSHDELDKSDNFSHDELDKSDDFSQDELNKSDDFSQDVATGFSNDKMYVLSCEELDKSDNFLHDAPVGFSNDNETDVISNDELDKSDNLSHDELDKSDDFPQDASAGFSNDNMDVLSCDELDKSDNLSHDELDKSYNFSHDASAGYSSDKIDDFPQNELDKSDDFPQDGTAGFSTDNIDVLSCDKLDKPDNFSNDELDKSDNFSNDELDKSDNFSNDQLDKSDNFLHYESDKSDYFLHYESDKSDNFSNDELDKSDNFSHDAPAGFSNDKTEVFSHDELDKSDNFSHDAPVGFSIETDVFSNDELDKSDNLSHDDLDKSDDFPQDATAGFSNDDIDVLSCDELDKSDNFSHDATAGFSNDDIDVLSCDDLDKSDNFSHDAPAGFSNDSKTDCFSNDKLDRSGNSSLAMSKSDDVSNDVLDDLSHDKLDDESNDLVHDELIKSDDFLLVNSDLLHDDGKKFKFSPVDSVETSKVKAAEEFNTEECSQSGVDGDTSRVSSMCLEIQKSDSSSACLDRDLPVTKVFTHDAPSTDDKCSELDDVSEIKLCATERYSDEPTDANAAEYTSCQDATMENVQLPDETDVVIPANCVTSEDDLHVDEDASVRESSFSNEAHEAYADNYAELNVQAETGLSVTACNYVADEEDVDVSGMDSGLVCNDIALSLDDSNKLNSSDQFASNRTSLCGYVSASESDDSSQSSAVLERSRDSEFGFPETSKVSVCNSGSMHSFNWDVCENDETASKLSDESSALQSDAGIPGFDSEVVREEFEHAAEEDEEEEDAGRSHTSSTDVDYESDFEWSILEHEECSSQNSRNADDICDLGTEDNIEQDGALLDTGVVLDEEQTEGKCEEEFQTPFHDTAVDFESDFEFSVHSDEECSLRGPIGKACGEGDSTDDYEAAELDNMRSDANLDICLELSKAGDSSLAFPSDDCVKDCRIDVVVSACNEDQCFSGFQHENVESRSVYLSEMSALFQAVAPVYPKISNDDICSNGRAFVNLEAAVNDNTNIEDETYLNEDDDPQTVELDLSTSRAGTSGDVDVVMREPSTKEDQQDLEIATGEHVINGETLSPFSDTAHAVCHDPNAETVDEFAAGNVGALAMTLKDNIGSKQLAEVKAFHMSDDIQNEKMPSVTSDEDGCCDGDGDLNSPDESSIGLLLSAHELASVKSKSVFACEQNVENFSVSPGSYALDSGFPCASNATALVEPESTSTRPGNGQPQCHSEEVSARTDEVGMSNVPLEDCMCLEISSTSDDCGVLLGEAGSHGDRTTLCDAHLVVPELPVDEEKILDVETYTEESEQTADELGGKDGLATAEMAESLCKYCSFIADCDASMLAHLHQTHQQSLSQNFVEDDDNVYSKETAVKGGAATGESSNSFDQTRSEPEQTANQFPSSPPESLSHSLAEFQVPSDDDDNDDDENDVIFMGVENLHVALVASRACQMLSADHRNDMAAGATCPGIYHSSADRTVAGQIDSVYSVSCSSSVDLSSLHSRHDMRHAGSGNNLKLLAGSQTFSLEHVDAVCRGRTVDLNNRALITKSNRRHSNLGSVAFVTRAIDRPIMTTTLQPEPSHAASSSVDQRTMPPLATVTSDQDNSDTQSLPLDYCLSQKPRGASSSYGRSQCRAVDGPPPLMHISELRQSNTCGDYRGYSSTSRYAHCGTNLPINMTISSRERHGMKNSHEKMLTQPLVPPPAHSKLPISNAPFAELSLLRYNSRTGVENLSFNRTKAHMGSYHRSTDRNFLPSSHCVSQDYGGIPNGPVRRPRDAGCSNQVSMIHQQQQHQQQQESQTEVQPKHAHTNVAFGPNVRSQHSTSEFPFATAVATCATNSCLVCSFQASDRWSLYNHLQSHINS